MKSAIPGAWDPGRCHWCQWRQRGRSSAPGLGGCAGYLLANLSKVLLARFAFKLCCVPSSRIDTTTPFPAQWKGQKIFRAHNLNPKFPKYFVSPVYPLAQAGFTFISAPFLPPPFKNHCDLKHSCQRFNRYIPHLNMGSLKEDAKLFCRFLFWLSVELSPFISAKIPSQMSSAKPSLNSDWKKNGFTGLWERELPGQVRHRSPSSWHVAQLERPSSLVVVHAVAQTISPAGKNIRI